MERTDSGERHAIRADVPVILCCIDCKYWQSTLSGDHMGHCSQAEDSLRYEYSACSKAVLRG